LKIEYLHRILLSQENTSEREQTWCSINSNLVLKKDTWSKYLIFNNLD
jgi:hypothetical protein